MGYIVWKNAFATGIEEIDEQHRTFLGYVNTLHDAVSSGSGEVTAPVILQELTDYVLQHFAAEESMLAADPALLAAQKLQHDYFLHELMTFTFSLAKGQKCANQMLLFLRDWFLNHIMTEDKRSLASPPPLTADRMPRVSQPRKGD